MAVSLLPIAGLVALALLALARASRRERAVEAAFPALGRIITVNGHRLHALTMGTGPDVILIHGASGNLRDLLPLMQALAPDYRVTAFDRPGMGWSDPISGGTSLAAQAGHLAAGALQLGLRDPLLVGQSYGGSVALSWALEAPLVPRALVLVSSPSLPWPGKLDPWYRLTNTQLGRALAIPLVAAFTPDGYVTATTAAIFAPNPVPDGYADQIGAGLALRRSTLLSNTAQVNALRSELVAQMARYPSLTLPVELIHGDADTIVPLTIHSRPLSGLIPGANLTVVPGLGHMPHHAALDAVMRAIARADQRSRLR